MKANLYIVLDSVLKHFKVLNDSIQTEVRVRSHPDYPSLKSLCDTIEEFGIKTYPTKVSTEQLKEIEGSFIAHIREDGEKVCAFVRKYSSETVEYYSSSKRKTKISTENFHKIYTGIVVQLEKIDHPVAKKKTPEQLLSNLLPYSLVASYCLILVWQFLSNFEEIISSEYQVILVITKFLGVTITGLLVYRDWSSDKSFSERICKSGKNIDCDSVLNSRFSEVYSWIKWSDIGFIYFSGSLLLVVSRNEFIPLLQGLSLIASVYIFISTYQQSFLIKKWCVFCLGVLLVLSVEAGITYLESWQLPSISSVITGILCFLILGITILLLKHENRTKNQVKELTVNYNKQKRDPKVFKALWLNEQQIITPDSPYNILLGNRSRFALRITVFLSLTCKYCGETFRSLKSIMENYPDICIHIIPVLGNKKDKIQTQFMGILLEKSRSSDTQEAYSTLEGWYLGEYHKNSINPPPIIANQTEIFIHQNLQHATRNQINQFPSIFLQSKLKPQGYTLEEALGFKEIINKPILSALPSKKEMIINT